MMDSARVSVGRRLLDEVEILLSCLLWLLAHHPLDVYTRTRDGSKGSWGKAAQTSTARKHSR